jgi:hypothetical protein
VDRLQAGDPGQIGPFQLPGRLGEGGMGRVFIPGPSLAEGLAAFTGSSVVCQRHR